MFTFIAFLLTLTGCANWLMIGLLQYDFVAGLFGWQGSIFSRLSYILIGVGAIYLLVRVIVNKGTFKIFEKKKKKEKQQIQNAPITQPIEAANEQVPKEKKKKWWQFWKKKEKNTQNLHNDAQNTQNPSQNTQQNTQTQSSSNSMFDEHFEN